MNDQFFHRIQENVCQATKPLFRVGLVLGIALSQADVQAQSQPWVQNGNDINNTNSGNVGIGTTSPQESLHVNGNMRLGDSSLINADFSVFANRPFFQTTSSNNGTYVQLMPNGTANWGSFIAYGGSDKYNAPAIAYGIGEATSNVGSILLSKIGTGIAADLSIYDTSRKSLMYIKQSGNIGIGTTTPTEKFEVAGNAKITGNLDVDGNLAAKYQDVAEWVKSSKTMLPGTVAILDPALDNQVLPSDKAYDTRVAGVISTQPGIALGEKGAEKVLVAATGRVKVKATASNGPIAIGDLLVTSGQKGTAMRSAPVKVSGISMHRPGTVLGKALQSLKDGDGEILVLLTLQ